MKRVLTLFMMLTAVIVLAACGTSKEKTAEKTKQQQIKKNYYWN